MSGTLSTIINAIETVVVTAGFVKSSEVFDFDVVPASIIHKAFRIESKILRNEYNIGSQANPVEEITIWIAYKTYRDLLAAWKTALDDRETIESAVINSAAILALASDPILMMNGEASTQKYLEDILVSKLVFTADYLRDI